MLEKADSNPVNDYDDIIKVDSSSDESDDSVIPSSSPKNWIRNSQLEIPKRLHDLSELHRSQQQDRSPNAQPTSDWPLPIIPDLGKLKDSVSVFRKILQYIRK